MTLRVSDLQSDSDLDSIRNSCDVLYSRLLFSVGHEIYEEDNKKQDLLVEIDSQVDTWFWSIDPEDML